MHTGKQEAEGLAPVLQLSLLGAPGGGKAVEGQVSESKRLSAITNKALQKISTLIVPSLFFPLKKIKTWMLLCHNYGAV